MQFSFFVVQVFEKVTDRLFSIGIFFSTQKFIFVKFAICDGFLKIQNTVEKKVKRFFYAYF